MKSTKKILSIVLLVCIMTLAIVALVACKSNDTYTVKVVDADGVPYASAQVQLCKVESDGNLSTCYSPVATDANGVVTLTIGQEIPDEDVDEMEVHLLGLPPYLTYDAVRMHKGEEVTVTLKVNLSTALSGTGEGSYGTDWLGNETLNMDPYVVGEGAYALEFTSADQLIFFEFHAEAGVYKVYSVGSIDASVTQLTGTKMNGIRNTGEESFTNDNVSATDKNFLYQFEISNDLVVQTKGMNSDIDYGACFFEISLKNADDINKSAIIVFEFVDEYEEPSTTDVIVVTPAQPLTPFGDQSGYYVDADLDGTFTYEKHADGYYYLADGALLVATLGKGTVAPRGLDIGFWAIYEQGQSMNFNVDGIMKNYAPIVEAYTEASNGQGRYPVTDELIEFLSLYIEQKYTVSQLEEVLLTHLPEGEEWLVWCGYYKGDSIDQPSDSQGTEDDPFMLEPGTLTIDVSAGGAVYYAVFSFMPTTYLFTTMDANVKITAYNSATPTNVVVSQYEDGFCTLEVTTDSMAYFYIVFSTEDGSAATYSVLVREVESQGEAEEGSEENPIQITYMGEYYNYIDDVWSAIWYSYTVTADGKLYFDWDANTAITVMVGYSQISSMDEEDVVKLQNGIDVNAGDEIKIMVLISLDGNVGDVCFTISNNPIA